MPNSLFQAISSDVNKNKIQIGYAVSSYSDTLSALGKSKEFNFSSSGGTYNNEDVSVAGVSFGEDGFSEGTQYLWKMEAKLFDSLPVQDTANRTVSIATLDDSQKTRHEYGNENFCPTIISTEHYRGIQNNYFDVGCVIDVDDKLIKYLNKFFIHAATKGRFTRQNVWSLINRKCFAAEIIFGGTKSTCATIVGKTPMSNVNMILINPTLFSSPQFSEAGITISVRVNNGEIHNVIPSDGLYDLPITTTDYDYSNARLGNYGREIFNDWIRINKETNNNTSNVLSLEQIQNTTVYVRVFIPESKRAEANNFLPDGVNESLFTTYKETYVKEVKITDRVFNGKAFNMMQGVINRWRHAKANGPPESRSPHYSMTVGKDRTLRVNTTGKKYDTFGMGSFEPIYVFDKYKCDCSGLVSMMMADSGMFDTKKHPSFTAFDTGNLSAEAVNKYLLPQYKCVKYDIDKEPPQSGDILYITKEERSKKHEPSTAGHATLLVSYNGKKTRTLEIGGTTQKRIECNHERNPYYYTHILRFEDA